jgi:hypothetical protein
MTFSSACSRSVNSWVRLTEAFCVGAVYFDVRSAAFFVVQSCPLSQARTQRIAGRFRNRAPLKSEVLNLLCVVGSLAGTNGIARNAVSLVARVMVRERTMSFAEAPNGCGTTMRAVFEMTGGWVLHDVRSTILLKPMGLSDTTRF